MEDLAGRHFGGYELKELVGAGGMASIYKGYDDTLSRWVAVKVVTVDPSEKATENMLARFRLEAQAIASLRHRNILTIYSYGEEEGWAYFVMEYVPGGSLKDRMGPDKLFGWESALTIIIPVAEALAFAHERGVIHRDIKPANILMPQDDWPLLADFGLAKMQHTTGTRPNLTMPGQVLGTMAYAAPEQIQEGEISPQVDIYSLAIVLYELLTGTLPFYGETTFDFLMARLTDPPRPLLEANPDVSELFAPIIDKALAQDPQDRYQTMEELCQALKEVRNQLEREKYAGESTPTPATGPLAEKSPPKIHIKIMAGEGEIVAQDKSELQIGRTYKNNVPDIDLGPYGGSKAGVSRRHARLIYHNHRWYVEDLVSTNGTFVNGAKIAPHNMMPLEDGDVIRCGQVELELRIE